MELPGNWVHIGLMLSVQCPLEHMGSDVYAVPVTLGWLFRSQAGHTA